MGRLFWFLMAALGLLLLVLIVTHSSGVTMGVESGQFALIGILCVWAVFLGTGVFTRSMPIGETIRNLGIWVLIIAFLMVAYTFSETLQSLGSKATGGAIEPPVERRSNGIDV